MKKYRFIMIDSRRWTTMTQWINVLMRYQQWPVGNFWIYEIFFNYM